jgi:hypothetical protein
MQCCQKIVIAEEHCDLKVVCKSNHTKSSKYYQKLSINWLSSRIVHQQFAGYNFIRIIHSMKNV